jgi:hypothetical protein
MLTKKLNIPSKISRTSREDPAQSSAPPVVDNAGRGQRLSKTPPAEDNATRETLSGQATQRIRSSKGVGSSADDELSCSRELVKHAFGAAPAAEARAVTKPPPDSDGDEDLSSHVFYDFPPSDCEVSPSLPSTVMESAIECIN